MRLVCPSCALVSCVVLVLLVFLWCLRLDVEVGHWLYSEMLPDGPSLLCAVLLAAVLAAPLPADSVVPVLVPLSAEAGFPLACPASGLAADSPLEGEVLSAGLELAAGDDAGVDGGLVLGVNVGLTEMIGPLDGCPVLYGCGLLGQAVELPGEFGATEVAGPEALPSGLPWPLRADPPGWGPLLLCEPGELTPVWKMAAGLARPT